MRIDAMSELTVGFVGLGNMGWPMAANLHAAGFSLVVRDADAARQARFAAEHPGAVAADSPAAFAAADIVVTMLPNGAVVARRAAWLGDRDRAGARRAGGRDELRRPVGHAAGWRPTWPRTASGWWTRRCPAASPAPSPASSR